MIRAYEDDDDEREMCLRESSGERESDLQVGQTILTPHRLGWTCFNNYSDASTIVQLYSV